MFSEKTVAICDKKFVPFNVSLHNIIQGFSNGYCLQIVIWLLKKPHVPCIIIFLRRFLLKKIAKTCVIPLKTFCTKNHLVKGLQSPIKQTEKWGPKYDVRSTSNKGENVTVDRNFAQV